MKKEVLLFVGSVILSMMLGGAISSLGLLIFGFMWLVFGDG